MKMPRKFRREIEIETRQLTVRPGSRVDAAKQCQVCKEESPLFSPEVISEVLPVTTREIYRLVETDLVHFLENKDSQILVCVASLMHFNDIDAKQIKKEE